MRKILLIEGDMLFARDIQTELEHEGYEVSTIHDGIEALDKIDSNKLWNLILLDIQLTSIGGMEVLRQIRINDLSTLVMVISAKDSIPNRVRSLDLGANDYLAKPFAIEELLARIRNLFRMKNLLTSQTHELLLQGNGLVMNLKSREVTRENLALHLTPTEFNLLRFLLQHKNEALPREKIISEVWGYDFVGDTNVVDVYIRYLRQKIDKGFPTKLLHTIRGIGYMLKVHDT